jgi:hypothetical protein
MEENTMATFLTLTSGVCWTIVYITLIVLGFKQKTYGMPLWALTLNLAWELTYGIDALISGPLSLQGIVNNIWAALDVVILVTLVRYGNQYLKVKTQHLFFIEVCAALTVSIIVQATLINYLGVAVGAAVSAYLQNLLMSILFIQMLIMRSGVEGQSEIIAVAKFVGTLAPTILFVIRGNYFVLWIGILCAIFDILYIGLLHQKQKLITAKNRSIN